MDRMPTLPIGALSWSRANHSECCLVGLVGFISCFGAYARKCQKSESFNIRGKNPSKNPPNPPSCFTQEPLCCQLAARPAPLALHLGHRSPPSRSLNKRVLPRAGGNRGSFQPRRLAVGRKKSSGFCFPACCRWRARKGHFHGLRVAASDARSSSRHKGTQSWMKK